MEAQAINDESFQACLSDPVKPTAAIKAKTVCEDPKMVHFTDFLSPDEAAHLLRLAEGRWVRSTVTRGSASALLRQAPNCTPQSEGCAPSACEEKSPAEEEVPEAPREVQSQTCTSSSCRLDYEESLVVERVIARAATVAGFPLEHVEKLVLVRYRPGETFKLHHDGAMRPKTVFAYLNDVPEGGETRFPHLGLQVRPSLGTAVMWPNVIGSGEDAEADRRMDHEALPPAEGYVKYGVNCFVNARPQRDCSHIKLVHIGAGA
mmetsp:Transcript_9645/g.34313  ORF Transcript_9645/g.34313 Transcript_9645/m.34313 type:complete len:262 (+) Transcript_9645:42-827(+)